MPPDTPQDTPHNTPPNESPRRGIANERLRRLVILLGFALLVVSLFLFALSVAPEEGSDGTLRLVDKSSHTWSMTFAAAGIALFAIARYGVLWLVRMAFAFVGLALGLLAANAFTLDSAVLRWMSILIAGLIGWGAGVLLTAFLARLFGR